MKQSRPKEQKPVWLTNILEVTFPLRPGDRIDDGKVYEVRKLKSMSSPIAGKQRHLYAVLHGGFRSIVVVVVLNGEQTEWSLT